QVHPVEAPVHQAREQAADPEVSTGELTDDVADCRVIAERHERTEVAVAKRSERASLDARSNGTREQARFLVRRLRARRHRLAVGRWQCRAITEREDRIVAR